jgi:molybdopterin synthase catalytic subunit
MSEIRIQREDFDPGVEIAALSDIAANVGAIASFVGLVRSDGGLVAMTLDHYPGFAEREIAAHVLEAKKRWPLLAVRIVHRVGRLTPKSASCSQERPPATVRLPSMRPNF